MSKNCIISYFDSVPKKCKLQSDEDGIKTSEMNPTDTNYSNASESVSLEQKQTRVISDCESDIGNFITQTNTVNDYLKSVILKRNNIPTNDFQYPFSTHTKNGKIEKRFLRKN